MKTVYSIVQRIISIFAQTERTLRIINITQTERTFSTLFIWVLLVTPLKQKSMWSINF